MLALDSITDAHSIREKHRARWRTFWNQSFIHLQENDYLENLYYIHLYQLGCSSLGRNPLTFAGLWGWFRDSRNWGHFYHWNHQQTYWGLHAAGHSELLANYLDYRFRMLAHAKEDAKRLFGVDGAFYSDISNLNGCNAIEPDTVRNLSVGLQIALDFYRHVRYTMDTAFLKEKALPVMTACADLYLNLMQSVHNASYDDITIINGIYDTEAVGLSNIPIAIASAMASAILPSIAGSFETKKKKDVRHKISVAIKTIMFIAIPSAVGMTVLSRPIVWLLYNTNTDSIRLGGRLLAALGASIVFYSLSTLSNSILQAVGKASKPVTNAVIALAVQTVVAAALLIFTDLGIYSLPIAVTVYSFMMCLLNGIAVKKATGYHQEIEKTFVLPLVSSAIMGLVVAGIYYGLTLTVLKGYLGNAVALLLSVAIGGLTYFAAALKLGVMSKKELLGIPGGSMIVKFAVKLYLLKN